MYYSTSAQGGLGGKLSRIPSLGGTPREVLQDVDGRISFSPDGRRFTFGHVTSPPNVEQILFVADADGSNVRRLLSYNLASYGPPFDPAWSPDGHVIIWPRAVVGRLVAVDVETGREEVFSDDKWVGVSAMAWLPDGSGLIVSGRRLATTRGQLWRVKYPSGEVQSITSDLTNYRSVSLTADGSTLATLQVDLDASLWVAPGGHATETRQITPGGAARDGAAGLAWMPDGHVVYASFASGNLDIWLSAADGSNRRQLTFGPDTDFSPTPCGEGHYVVFLSIRGGRQSVWRVDTDTRQELQLTHGATSVVCSADGQSVFYSRTAQESPGVWRIGINGEERAQVTHEPMEVSAISPDGRQLAGGYYDQTTRRYVGAIFDIERRQLRTLDVVELPVTWGPDPGSVYFLNPRGNGQNLWRLSLAVGAATRVTNFTGLRLFNFAWSRDGRTLACSRGAYRADVVLLRNQ